MNDIPQFCPPKCPYLSPTEGVHRCAYVEDEVVHGVFHPKLIRDKRCLKNPPGNMKLLVNMTWHGLEKDALVGGRDSLTRIVSALRAYRQLFEKVLVEVPESMSSFLKEELKEIEEVHLGWETEVTSSDKHRK